MNLEQSLMDYFRLQLGVILCVSLQTRAIVRAAQPEVAAAPHTSVVTGQERGKIRQALPAEAFVAPAKPRKLLVFDRNVGYPGHRSIDYANEAFTLMGETTGAFDTVISRDPQVFRSTNLQKFDAVFLNNTVGNLFEDAELRRNLVEFVYGGGGLLGVHGTTVAFTQWPGAREDWPEFGILIGARGASHRDSNEHVVIKLDDPQHPVNRPFGGEGFDFRDEFFRVHDPYSRNRVRVLLSIDTEKTDMNQGASRGNSIREDNDYALAWIRNYGRGRVFYCTIAHNPYVFWDRKMLSFYLAATQFALGDLPAPTTPSGRLTPAVRAQEKLGWRLGITVDAPETSTLFETVDSAAETGLTSAGGADGQRVSHEIPKYFDFRLGDDERRQIRLKLDSAGVRLLTYHAAELPNDDAGCRKVFEFSRTMGVEAIIADPSPGMLDLLENLCDQYDLKLAICDEDSAASAHDWSPERIVEACLGRSKRIGACADIGRWSQSGVDAVEAVNRLNGRLMMVRTGSDGTNASRSQRRQQGEQLLDAIHRLEVKPTMFAIEYSKSRSDAPNNILPMVGFFNRVTLDLAQ